MESWLESCYWQAVHLWARVGCDLPTKAHSLFEVMCRKSRNNKRLSVLQLEYMIGRSRASTKNGRVCATLSAQVIGIYFKSNSSLNSDDIVSLLVSSVGIVLLHGCMLHAAQHLSGYGSDSYFVKPVFSLIPLCDGVWFVRVCRSLLNVSGVVLIGLRRSDQQRIAWCCQIVPVAQFFASS